MSKEQKEHIPATPKTGLSSDSPRVVNIHPEHRRLEFSKTQCEMFQIILFSLNDAFRGCINVVKHFYDTKL